MEQPLTVRGRYFGRTFIPDGPMPDGEGTAELIITPIPSPSHGSVADAFGRAAVLRSGDELLTQLRADRDEWGDR